MKNLLSGIIATLCFISPQLLAAESSPQRFVDVSPCIAIQDDESRHTCFDEITKHLQILTSQSVTAPQAPQASPADTQSRQTSEATTEESSQESKGRSLLGIFRRNRAQAENEEIAEKSGDTNTAAESVARAEPVESPETINAVESFGRNSARVEQSSQGESVLYDRIVSLQEREPSQYIITLASGQVWYQTVTKRFRMKEQMEVSISLSPIGGSYRLSSPEAKGFIQVRRIE